MSRITDSFQSIVALATFLAITSEGKCQPANSPKASSLYISRSSSWEKTTISRVADGVREVASTYSYGSRSSNNSASTGSTRYYNNGIVTYSSVWIQTKDKYRATPAFQAPYLPGWTLSSNVRYSSSFCLDYLIPSTWNGHLELDLRVVSKPVDNRGHASGQDKIKYSMFTRGSGQSGRFHISGMPQSKTVSKDSTVYYFLH